MSQNKGKRVIRLLFALLMLLGPGIKGGPVVYAEESGGVDEGGGTTDSGKDPMFEPKNQVMEGSNVSALARDVMIAQPPPQTLADDPATPKCQGIRPSANQDLTTQKKIKGGPEDTGKKQKPSNFLFLTKNNSVITAQAGSKALLPCSVRNCKSDGTISWIRRSDYNLLTVGPNTYAGDERFSTIHKFNTDDWALQIKFVQLRDAGLYECQVTSHPPYSILLKLIVVEARVEITGPPEKYVKLGSSVELLCKLVDSPSVPEFVFWYHNDRMVNYDKGRGMNITTDLVNKKSSLVITKASREHSGNYSCVASNASPGSVFVHILNEENPAAMQTGSETCTSPNKVFTAMSVLLILLLSCCD